VLEVHAEVGEVVAPLSPIVTLGDLDHPLVEVFVPPNSLSGIQRGAQVKVRTDALKAPLEGRVDYISLRTEFTPRYVFSDPERSRFMVRVRVRVEAPKHLMFAGVPAFLRFEEKP